MTRSKTMKLIETPRHERFRKTLQAAVKLLLLPFRFAWLLIVWLRLRVSAIK